MVSAFNLGSYEVLDNYENEHYSVYGIMALHLGVQYIAEGLVEESRKYCEKSWITRDGVEKNAHAICLVSESAAVS